MTEQMAIEYLLNRYLVVGSPVNPPKEECEKHNAVIDMAIQALEKQSMVNEVLNELKQYREIGTVEELQALKEKSEKGLLLELPCKVGDTVWCLVSLSTKIVECEVLWIEKHRNGVMLFVLNGGWGDVVLANLGEKWFLTKEEAEKKLNGA